MKDPIPELIELLGCLPVFIGWPSGSKGIRRKWKHLTIADMTLAEFQRRASAGEFTKEHEVKRK
jgi:hypothetical protein